MVAYNVVKYCRHCKKRFVVSSKDKKKLFCPDCKVQEQAFVDQYLKRYEDEEKEAEEKEAKKNK